MWKHTTKKSIYTIVYTHMYIMPYSDSLVHTNIFSHTLIVYCSFIGKFLRYTKQVYTTCYIRREATSNQKHTKCVKEFVEKISE